MPETPAGLYTVTLQETDTDCYLQIMHYRADGMPGQCCSIDLEEASETFRALAASGRRRVTQAQLSEVWRRTVRAARSAF